MIAKDLLKAITNYDGKFLFGEFEDTVLIEMPDETYRNIKEIFWLPNGHLALRLEEEIITEAQVQNVKKT